jgi:hypothetical protein
MNILLVTSEGQCGIAEHSAMLKNAVESVDLAPQITLTQGVIHPTTLLNMVQYSEHPAVDIVHLNFHAALHSQYTPDVVRSIQALGKPVVVTYHDSGVPNSSQCLNLYEVADAFVVHEPCADLPEAHYWRQGVPAGQMPYPTPWEARPVLGTVGFPFPWKNYDLLCEATARAGWSLLLLAPRATEDDVQRWLRLNPNSAITQDFLPAADIVARLSGCDATAFVYNCHNTGTSGAIRQGIAARKPVIASRFDEYCTAGRQFRDLVRDPLASRVITWINPDVQQLADTLTQVRIAPIDAGMVALATQDSWKSVGEKYAQLYRSLL